MTMFNHTLDHVRVAAPCNVDWDSMFGDERVRFCGQCKLNVYNLSEMSKTEAELLVARSEGRLASGITKDAMAPSSLAIVRSV